MSENKTRTALRLTAKTDVGRVREHNEDNYVVCPDVEKKEWFFSDTTIESEEGTLLVVADGMGGLNAGEVASAIAIETIQQYFNQDNRTKIETHEQVKAALIDCINIAQTNMLNHAKAHPDTTGMGTTIVIAFIKDNILHTAWVGDSRCYVLRKNTELYYATKDHSYVQELVDSNQITMEQAFYHPESNIITRSLGDNSNKTPKPDVCAYPIVVGDKILLCSDGLNGMLQDDAILKILHNTENINEAAINLISAANEAGGHDNITLILSEIISVSNETFPDNIKLRAMELAVNFNQLDSGNPFQTLKPNEILEDKKGEEVVKDIYSSDNSKKKKIKKGIIFFIVFLFLTIISTLLIIQFIKVDKEKKDLEVLDVVKSSQKVDSLTIPKLKTSKIDSLKKKLDNLVKQIISDSIKNKNAKILQTREDIMRSDSIQKVLNQIKEISTNSDTSKSPK